HTRSYGDWSSDVCSSDLAPAAWDPVDPGLRESQRRVRPPARLLRRGTGRVGGVEAATGSPGRGGLDDERLHAVPAGPTARTAGEIGRASCRERVEGPGGV